MENLFADIDFFHNMCIKLSYIRHEGSKWKVYSEKGKVLGTYDTKGAAEKRLRQIEYFKHKKANKEEIINLTHLDKLSYSSIMRELRKQNQKEVAENFMRVFKQIFDALVINGEENPADKALPATLLTLSKVHPLEF